MELIDEYIQRCSIEVNNCRTNRSVEEAREQLWHEFKSILMEIKDD